MIRSLQKKFILIAMMSLLCVTVVLIGAINVTNFIRIDQRAEDLLTMLSSREKPFDKIPHPGDAPEFPDDTFFGKHKDPNVFITPETEFTTRWFSVTYDLDGTFRFASVDQIAAVTEGQAKELGDQILDSGRTHGYKGIYKYRLTTESDTETLWFLNCENELNGALFLLITTVFIGLICLLILLLLISLFSRRAVRPVLENMERQKRFITDAGHELKTPLSIISANADVLSMTGQENEWVQSIRKQTDRMGNLVQDLLTLARAEESVEGTERLDFNLSDAVVDTAMPFTHLARMKGKTVTLDILPDIIFRGDEGSLRRLVSILMENAVKYSSVPGQIFLSLRRENRKIFLVQSNSCDEIPEKEDLNRLFDRFYRADPSRSRERGGYGIGLSIAQSIVESHKGNITVSAEKKTICFSVVLSERN